MNRFRRRVCLVLFSLLLPVPAVAGPPLPAGCNVGPIEEVITSAGYDGMRPTRLSMSFSSEIFRDDVLGVERTVIVPTITLSSDVSVFVENRRSELESEVRQKVRDAGLELTRFGFRSAIPLGPRLAIGGNMEVEKWWKTKWVCCKWFSCHTCWAKGHLFSRGLDFSVDVERNFNPIPVNFVNQSASIQPSTVPTTLRAEGIISLQLQAKGKTDAHRSVLEKIWDLVGSMFSWVDHELFHGDSTWRFSDWLDQTFEKRVEGPDPYLFQRQLYSFGTPKGGSDNPLGRRWFWQSFVAGLNLNQAETGFSSEAGSPAFASVFTLDYSKYSRLMNKNDLGGGGPAYIVNPLVSDVFCSSAGRAMVERYVAAVRDGFNRTEQVRETIQLAEHSLIPELEARYGVTGVDAYIRSAGRVSRPLAARGNVVAELPSVQHLTDSPGIMPTGGNLWALAREQRWTKKHYRCAVRLARRRTGSADLVFPFHSYEQCIGLNEYTSQQKALLESLFPIRPTGSVAFETVEFATPIVGNYEYRGWYYCGAFTTACVGKERILWWQQPSVYGSRGGRQLGVDLISSTGREEIELAAVANGVVTYANFADVDWGHTLLLPFQKDGKSLVAVYSNLSERARGLDGANVKAGQSLGLLGCTLVGGASDARCNRTCVINGIARSDAHLHFEIHEFVDNSFRKVDPIQTLALRPASGLDRRIYNCRL